MNQNVIHVGVDVDDVSYHGAALAGTTGECFSFRSGPTLKGLLSLLEKVRKALDGGPLKVCYEASYLEFSLHRDLQSPGVACAAVAPSSIPSRRGKAVKTDRLDALVLARFYANDLLTEATAPGAELRSRS